MRSHNADMPQAEFLSSLAALGQSRAQAAALFKINYRAVCSWASGSVPVPVSAALALRLMIDHHVDPVGLLPLRGPSAGSV